jgi:site-specific DNA-methyltransferase (adenine-specific)
MAHKSFESTPLRWLRHNINSLQELVGFNDRASVMLLHFPFGRSDSDASSSDCAFDKIAHFCRQIHDESVICILTTPPDAARLIPRLEKALQFQLWVAVKLKEGVYPTEDGQLANRHAALLILTRYRKSLRHALTRIGYTYCPACGKTTKDYGGKKHIYNSYGTLISDVWRDIECDPTSAVPEIDARLSDLFGLNPYDSLHILDMRSCSELEPRAQAWCVKEDMLPFFPKTIGVPPDSRLINDDCLVALRSLPHSSVDFCFADPPYNIEKKYDYTNDAMECKEYCAWCDEWLTQLGRVLKPGRTVAVINIPLWAVRHYQHLCKTLNFQAWIAWDGLSLPVRMIMPSHYAVICFSKGQPRALPGLDPAFLAGAEGRKELPMAEFCCVRSSCLAARGNGRFIDRAHFSDLWYDIHRLKHNSRRVDHPCQLPPSFMRRLFTLFTKPGEMVLDCFDGSGTSTLVAHLMERRFIGIEISAQYHKIAKERHEMLETGEDPFGKKNSIPLAKNSRVERLAKQKYKVSKKTLQLDVREIARKLGRMPTRDEVRAMSKYPIEYFDRYFVSWGEVCAAARHDGMSELPPVTTDVDRQLTLL